MYFVSGKEGNSRVFIASAPRFMRSLDLRIPLRRKRLSALRRRSLIRLAGRLVQPKLHDRNIRVRRRQKIVHPRLRQIQFHLVQRLKRIAEMHQDQIALVSKLGEERCLHWPVLRALAHLIPSVTDRRSNFAAAYKLFNNLFSFCAGRPPRLPVKAEKLMQHSRPFKRKRNRRKFSQRQTPRTCKSTQS